MKKYLPYLTVLFIISIIVVLFVSLSTSQNMTVVYTGNDEKKPIKIVLGKFQDSDCGMIIDDIAYASQVVSPSGKTYFFHDHGGMVNWLFSKEFKDKAHIWVMSRDTKRYIDGRVAWYSRTEQTPMLYGFGAYENQKDGLVDFDTMATYMLRGEHLANPKIKKILLGEQN